MVLTVSSSGGALGDETYVASYLVDGETFEFFEGTNAQRFALRRNGDVMKIFFCHGTVHKVEPIYLRKQEKMIRMQLDMACGGTKALADS